MLPQMSDALEEFLQAIILKRTTQTIINFRPVESTIDVSTQAVVQPAQKEKLNPDVVDWSLEYLQVHSIDSVKINDIFTYKGTDYKAIDLGNYSDYAYYETIFEQVK